MSLQSDIAQQFALEQHKSDLRIQEDVIKLENRTKRQRDCLEQRSLMREKEREALKSQFDMLLIDENGLVKVKTENLRIKADPRAVTNFTRPEISVLQRLTNQTEKLYIFSCELLQEFRYVILDVNQCGSSTYLLRKLSGIGAQILAPTLAKQKEYASQLITLLILQNNREDKVPDARGWFLDENGNLRFFNGRWTWEEAKRCAK